MSSLADHARRELEMYGAEPATIDWYLNVVQAFASIPGGSVSGAIPIINDLLQFKNLTPLTDNSDDWTRISSGHSKPLKLWQNRRRAEAFSHNGGKTYYLLSEGGTDENPYPQHKSVKHPRK